MKIILDYDSTLVDLMGPWIGWLKREYGVSVSTKDIKYFGWLKDAFGDKADDFWRTPGVYDTVVPLPGAQDFVSFLLRMGYDVSVVSASHPDMYVEKEIHCAKYFGLDMKHSHSKHELTKDALLIDDCPAHVHEHVRVNPGCWAFLFNYMGSYGWAKPLITSYHVRTVMGYNHIINLIKED